MFIVGCFVGYAVDHYLVLMFIVGCFVGYAVVHYLVLLFIVGCFVGYAVVHYLVLVFEEIVQLRANLELRKNFFTLRC